jgi:nucleobase:cation symporter-1, NCS1 family
LLPDSVKADMSDPQSDAQSTYDPLVPVPEASRQWGPRDAFSLWFSLGVGLLVLQAGAYLVPGLSPLDALIAIVLGSLIGATLLGLAGVVGTDTGLSTISALRPVLGIRGASVPAVLNIVQLLGWGGFEIIAVRDAADKLSKQSFGFSAPLVFTLVFGIAATLLAVMGPLSFVRRFLRHWGMWLLMAGAAWMTWALISNHDLAALWAKAGDGTLSMGGGIDMVCAMPLSWLPLIADYSRFGKSAKSTFSGTLLGYALANTWFYGLGAAYGLIAATDPRMAADGALISALAISGGGLALLLILIDETDNIFADIFSAAMSAQTLARIGLRPLIIGFGVLCILIAFFVPMAAYQDFLYKIGSVFAPLYGVLLCDHFLIRKRRIAADQIALKGGLYWYAAGFAPIALIAWVAGIGAYYAILSFAPAFGATLPAFAVSGIAYWGLKQIWR